MILTLSVYVTSGISLLTFIFFLLYYWIVLRKVRGFPVYHVIPYIMRYNMSRKKTVPFTNFLFQLVEDMYKKYGEDGYCTSYNANPTLYLFSGEPFKLVEDMYKKYGEDGYCTSYNANPTLYLFSGEPFKMFLNDKATLTKSPEYKLLEHAIGPGLITSNGERWKKHRKLISPAFQLGMLKEKVPLFNEHALALIEDLKLLENQPSSDHLSIIKRHYFNALSESIFGLKQNEENKTEIMKYFHVMDNLTMMTMYRAYQPWLWPKFALKLLPSGKKYLEMYDEIYSFAKKVIEEMMKHIASNIESDGTEYFSKYLRKSFAYILLQHHLKDPSFTFDDLHGQVNTFMAAGYDTVSYTTMWCLFMLGLYPEIQEKAFQEVHSSCHNYVTFEDMSSFIYLEAVIMETLRLYPTVPLLVRTLSQDFQFGNHKVHKGSTLVFSIYYWHRDPDHYPDPEKFDPQRFLSAEEGKPSQHIPFAEGNRPCVGKTYALIEMKIFLAHILRNFKITSLDKREDVELCLSVVLTPSKPLRFLITPRLNEICT